MTGYRRTVFRGCTLCEASCGLALELEGDRIVSVRGDEEDPLSTRLYLRQRRGDCRRAPRSRPAALADAKNSGRQVRADRLGGSVRDRRARGSTRCAPPTGRRDRASTWATRSSTTTAPCCCGRVSFTRSAPATASSAGSQDTSPALRGVLSSVRRRRGHAGARHRPHALFPVLGANPAVSNGSFMTAPRRARTPARDPRTRRKLVVVDPRRTETAREADEHVPIRPGGDAALLLAMLHVLRSPTARGRAAASRGSPRLTAVARATRATFTPSAWRRTTGVAAGDNSARWRSSSPTRHARCVRPHRRLQQPVRGARRAGRPMCSIWSPATRARRRRHVRHAGDRRLPRWRRLGLGDGNGRWTSPRARPARGSAAICPATRWPRRWRRRATGQVRALRQLSPATPSSRCPTARRLSRALASSSTSWSRSTST